MQTMKGRRLSAGAVIIRIHSALGLFELEGNFKQQKSLIHKAMRHEGGWDPFECYGNKETGKCNCFYFLEIKAAELEAI